MKQKLTILLIFLCFISKAQIDTTWKIKNLTPLKKLVWLKDKTDTTSIIDTNYVWKLPPTMSSIYTYSITAINEKEERYEPYNIVGIYSDGSLKMFAADYLIHKIHSSDWEIHGAWSGNLIGLIGIYSYEDENGTHYVKMSVCHKFKKANTKQIGILKIQTVVNKN